MLKWAIELSEYGIEYQPRLSMKGQVMADFIAECYRRKLGVKKRHKEVLRTGTLLEESKHAHRIWVQAARFTLIGDYLYKQSFGGPYLRCLHHSEAQYVLAELHEGVCGNHSGGRSLAHSAHLQGYYWPTMKRDAEAYVKRCDKCQRYAPIPHMPSVTLNPIASPWPFTQWGMDIVGPLPTMTIQKKFLLVATDYFSK
ncbi:hypothetical protein CK203_039589 [Vitis vinifera]|uniref:Integrase zinc-binding domain-containing protein n=1 Tax=Vitis vinifera TaxID=29760 RepID=A0A438HFS4_VITVI|nr:hypothetical protein CK203_039589 [Vitis vinifera]